MKTAAILIYTMFLYVSNGQLLQLPLEDPMIHSGPQNLTISEFSYQPVVIDINEDGIADISFNSTFNITHDVPTSGGAGHVSANSLRNYILSDNNYAVPSSTLGSGSAVLTTNSWAKGSFSIGSYSVNYLEGTTSGWIGPWKDVDIGYLSLLFRDSDNQLHSAKIRTLLPDDGLMGTIIIMDWFYGHNPLPEPSASEARMLSSTNALQFSFSNLHGGLQYILEKNTNLIDGVWTTNSIFTATSDSLSVTSSTGTRAEFWRLRRHE